MAGAHRPAAGLTMGLRSPWGRGDTAPPADPVSDGPVSGPAAWLRDKADPTMVAALLRQVIDPEIGVNIVDLGLIYGIRIDDGAAHIDMSLTTPGCPLSAYMEDNVGRVLWGAPGLADVDLQIVWEPAWAPPMMSARAKQELGWPA